MERFDAVFVIIWMTSAHFTHEDGLSSSGAAAAMEDAIIGEKSRGDQTQLQPAVERLLSTGRVQTHRDQNKTQRNLSITSVTFVENLVHLLC